MTSKALPAGVLALVLAAACSSGGKHRAAPSTPTPTAIVAPTAVATVGLTGDPLTGLAVTHGPIVAVKVDNGGLARPYQRGLTQAAIVYQELVEGGSTRFMAIFEGAGATKEVGPIRSARESDVDVLRGLGVPALAFSGANSGVLAIIHRAARSGYLKDASYGAVPSLYRLGERRRDARNFFAIPSRLGARVGGSQPRDIGWRFGALALGGAPQPAMSVPFSSSSVMRVVYDAGHGTYTLSQTGHAVPVRPVNVLILKVSIKRSGFSDVHGMNTPFTISRGTGDMALLRDGQRFVGKWKRDGYGVTHLLDPAGHDLLLKPGPTWVMLEPTSEHPIYR